MFFFILISYSIIVYDTIDVYEVIMHYILIIEIQNVGKTEHYISSLIICALVLCPPVTYFMSFEKDSYLALSLLICKLKGFELIPDAPSQL